MVLTRDACQGVFVPIEWWRRVCRWRVSDTHDGVGMWVQVYSVFAGVPAAGHGCPAGPPQPLSRLGLPALCRFVDMIYK